MSHMRRFRSFDVLLQLLINAIGKGIGFAREVLISSMFGVSAVTDAFFSIQQLLVFSSSYIMGAFNLAFVPAYIRNQAAGAAALFLRPLVFLLMAVGLTASITLALAPSEYLEKVLGFSQPNELLTTFAQILAWATVPTILTGIAFGVLHGERRHQHATILGSMSSVGMLLTLLLFYFLADGESGRVSALPWSYLCGAVVAGMLAVLVLRPRMLGTGRSETKPDFHSFMHAVGASSLENVGFNINQLSNVYFAAKFGEGLVAINAFAFRIGMLPLSLVSSQIGQIYQAWAARAVAEGAQPPKAMFFMLCLPSVFIAICMAVWGDFIIRLVYERGAFGADQTAHVAQLLVPYAAYFLVMSINQLAARHIFVIGKGMRYARAMLLAYGVALMAKVLVAGSLSQIIWSCVIAEGCVALWFCVQIAVEPVDQ